MPKRSSSPKRQPKDDPTDPILAAARIFHEVTTGELISGTLSSKPQPPVKEKNPHAVALGKLGGAKGGKARAEKLSARKRKQIAKAAAAARWGSAGR